MFAFVVTHLLNHALGLISLDAMEAGRRWFLLLWRNPPAEQLFMASVAIHVALAYWAIYRRRQLLRIPPGEALQLLLGLAVPPLLVSHVLGTRIAASAYGTEDAYSYVLLSLWVDDPNFGARQVAATLVVWGHACIGLYFWLRLKPWYRTCAPYLFGGALLLPVMALLGYVAGGREVARLAAEPGWRGELRFDLRLPDAEEVGALLQVQDVTLAFLAAMLAITLGARAIRLAVERRRGIVRVRFPGGRTVEAPPGTSILESSWLAGLPHASVCGGRGRCSTCRVRINDGVAHLPPMSDAERRVLERIKAAPNVRLACQARPTGDVAVTPLLPPQAGPATGFRQVTASQGQEREIAVLFADIRGFTALSEKKLPYDVVFILNRYFRSMGEAIESAGGRVDKFIGDGIMALFGTDRPAGTACADALAAARAMAAGLDDLNRLLAHDLPEPLRIGIGIHAGPAIVGEMGYGAAVSLTAIGDTVNTASRLETMTKEFSAQLVVSAHVAELAGVDLSGQPVREVAVRGREAALVVHVVADAASLPAKGVVPAMEAR
ncbi:MAG: adenylate/guanylate cyclase domain-containing protein [Alphaproteobacteria bacterium]